MQAIFSPKDPYSVLLHNGAASVGPETAAVRMFRTVSCQLYSGLASRWTLLCPGHLRSSDYPGAHRRLLSDQGFGSRFPDENEMTDGFLDIVV